MLYIGTDRPLPTIPWNEEDRKLNTADLDNHEHHVACHFTKPNLKYIGSDDGCGCGFRHVTFQSGGWPEETMIGSEHYTGEAQQPIHQQLYAFISKLLTDEESQIELYGCWDGDFLDPSAGTLSIPLSLLLDKSFYFRERFLYTVKQYEQSGPDNPRPCGTSVMPPADPASRAGDTPEASGGI